MIAVKAPKGAQLLYFPMYDCQVSGGYKNKDYKDRHGYVHYGVDFDDRWGKDFDVIASGEGTVLGIEKNKNSIGGVVVIRYNKVYIPKTGKIKDLIVRYYHFAKINVKKGDKVKAYQKIGSISGGHKWWNHIHFEMDTDTKFPFYTPQVKEAASDLLKRNKLSVAILSAAIINPMDVLVIGKKQKAKVHSLADCADPVKDAPQYEEAA